MLPSIQLCTHCKSPFTSDRSTAKYCSDDCKDAFHNQQKKQQRLALKRQLWMANLPRPTSPEGELLPQVLDYLQAEQPLVIQQLEAGLIQLKKWEAERTQVQQNIQAIKKEQQPHAARLQVLQQQYEQTQASLAEEQQENLEDLEAPHLQAFLESLQEDRITKLKRELEEQQRVMQNAKQEVTRFDTMLGPLRGQYNQLTDQLQQTQQERVNRIRQLNWEVYPLVVEAAHRIVIPENTPIRTRKKRPKPKAKKVKNQFLATGLVAGEITAWSVSPSATTSPAATIGVTAGADASPALPAIETAPNPLYFHHELGKSKTKDIPVLFRPSPLEVDFLPNGHLLCAGKSGSGKTLLQYHLAQSAARYGIPFSWIDFDGGATSLFTRQPVAGVTLQSASQGLNLNPLALAGNDPSALLAVADWVSASLARSFKLGLRQKSLLRKAIEQSYQPGLSLESVNGLANSKSTYLAGSEQNIRFPTFNQVWQRLLEAEAKDSSVESMLGKLEILLSRSLFEYPSLSLAESFTGSTVFNLQPLQSRETKAAVSLLILEQLYHYVLSLGETKEIRRILLIDEAHLLAGADVLSEMMRQARKAGLLLVLASQSPRDFASAILSEAGTYIGLKLEAEDARILAPYLGALTGKEKGVVQRLLVEQLRGEALIRNDHYHPYCQVQLKNL